MMCCILMFQIAFIINCFFINRISKQAFCFIDIGVHHESSSEESSVVRKIKLEPAEGPVSSDSKIGKVRPTPKGPFECTMAGCDYLTDSVVHFGKHWNVKHPVDPSKAVFKDQATGIMLDLPMIFNFIMQCKICNAVRMAREHQKHATQGIRAHIEGYHQAELLKSGGNVDVHFRVLKDSDGSKKDEEGIHGKGETSSLSSKDDMVAIEEKEVGDFKLVPFTMLRERGFTER